MASSSVLTYGYMGGTVLGKRGQSPEVSEQHTDNNFPNAP